MNFVKSLALLLTVGLVQAQDEPLFSAPELLWTQAPVSTDGPPVGVSFGNGLTMSPDGSLVIATTVGGVAKFFGAISGEPEYEYFPSSVAALGIVSSHSKAVTTTEFVETAPYMVYSVLVNEGDASVTTSVIALDFMGNELWVSPPIAGTAPGSPVVSDAGDYVFLTVNAEGNTVGNFVCISALDGSIFFEDPNVNTPYAPIGIFHSPIEGNYDDENGRLNNNDFLMWASAPNPNDATVTPGNIFGFQFAVDPANLNTTAMVLGDALDFRATAAPVMTNQGLTGYFGASRSSFWGWVGTTENPRGRFSRAANAQEGFTRNSLFPGAAVYATPAVSNHPALPNVFGGSAAAEVVTLSTDFSTFSSFTTPDLVKAGAVVDPFDRAVYFADVSGAIHQFPVSGTWAPIYSANATGSVEADMTLNSGGWVLYYADTLGTVSAWKVAEPPVTESPTAAPIMNTTAPTAMVIETEPPTEAPVSAAPTATPVVATAAPTAPPTSSSANKPVMVLSVMAAVLSLFV